MMNFTKIDRLKRKLDSFRPLPSEIVENLNEDLIVRWTYHKWYETDARLLHPVERAARVHSDFVAIHPFVDGNGRTSRLLMNFELMKEGFPPVILTVENRLAYYEALGRAHTKDDFSPFLRLIAGSVEKGFLPYWHALGVAPL